MKARPNAEAKKELVVFSVVGSDSKCAECGERIGRGGLLQRDGDRGLCMECADLGDLEFLGAGDPALTRRASKYSPLRAVVVRWSRTRNRYERQGILVSPAAIDRAEQECLADEQLRARRKLREAERRAVADAQYVSAFATKIREQYPNLPTGLEEQIAAHACRKYSGRVGRSAAAKTFDPGMIELAVRAHIRHAHTGYDRLLSEGVDRSEARTAVRSEVDRLARSWMA